MRADVKNEALGMEEKLVEEGYRKSKVKYRDPRGKTSRGARIEARDNALENKRLALTKVLEHELEGLKTEIRLRKSIDLKQDRSYASYFEWLNRTIVSGDWSVGRDELEIKFVRSGGEGGQRTNKKATAVIYVHTPTRFMTRNEDTPSQEENEKKSFSQMTRKIATHLGHWDELLNTFDVHERENKLKNYSLLVLQ